MAFVGGDIIEITSNHPTLGSITLFPKSSEDGTFNTGGFKGEDDMAKLAGDGSSIRALTRNRWSVEVQIAWDLNDANEIDKLSALAGSTDESDWTFTLINGTVWGGKGSPVGDIPGSTNTAIIPVKFSGGGELKKILG